MSYFKLSLDVCILFVLSKAALLHRTLGELFREASLDHIKFPHSVLDLIVLLTQVFTFTSQVSLHVGDIVVTAFICVSRSLLDQASDSAQFSSQHLYFLLQKVLLLFQGIVLPLKLNDLIFLVGCRHRHALARAIVKVIAVALGR